MVCYQAILLLGPTGVGKTPLGDLLESKGLNGVRCHHFDFGANLRAIAEEEPDERFSAQEISFVKDKLKKGALLEDKDFPLATKTLDSFIKRRGVVRDDLIILNGLPRHMGQAKDIAGMLDINLVIALSATPEVIRERIRENVDEDRTARTDDSLDEITGKLEIFEARTRPLLDYYTKQGVRIKRINVTAKLKADDMLTRIRHIKQGEITDNLI